MAFFEHFGVDLELVELGINCFSIVEELVV
jgi:hypothetical protein